MLKHITQRPVTTSCGVVCLEMVTNLSFDEICSRIKWEEGQRNYMTNWVDLRGVLASLGHDVGKPRKVTKWESIKELAIVNTGRADADRTHFMVYDGRDRTFYDPWRLEASDKSKRKPISYLPVPAPPSA